MQRTLVVTTLLCWMIVSWAQADILNNREMVLSYIDQYKFIAMSEMDRTGIPASIKLAQAILESNAGRSYLAIHGNNHFGMKCGSSWNGKTVYRKDDDRNKKGKLIKSCFRAYDYAEESFIAHSEFLMDPNKAYRYGFLFELDKNDYKAWSKGLKKSGYATNPKYAQLLINIIESYQLNSYDSGNHIIAANKNVIEKAVEELEEEMKEEHEVIPIVEAKKRKQDNSFFAGTSDSYRIYEKNKVAYLIADTGDSPEVISLETGIPLDLLLNYNDHVFHETQSLKQNTFVYLEYKKSSYKGGKKYHYVKAGETLADISQQYAVKLEKLRKRNRIQPGYSPVEGQKVYLKGKLSKKRSIRVVRDDEVKKIRKEPEQIAQEIQSNTIPEAETVPEPINSVQQDNEIIETTEIPREEKIAPIIHEEEFQRPDTVMEHSDVPAEEVQISKPLFYTVQKGDTLYAISRKFNVAVDELKKLNDWQAGQVLHIGDRVRIE